MKSFPELKKVFKFEESLKEVLGDLDKQNTEWSITVKNLKILRSLCAVPNSDKYFISDKYLITKIFTDLLHNLRSQVIKESCLTFTYISCQLGIVFDYFMVKCCQESVNMMISYPKVVKSAVENSILVCCKLVHSQKLLEMMLHTFVHKSNKVRSCSMTFVLCILETWRKENLADYSQKLFDIVKSALVDPDQEVRQKAKS